MSYSLYFVAKLNRSTIWFVSGCIRNQGRLAFERSLDPKNDLFEFFVTPAYEQEFVAFAELMLSKGHFIFYHQQPNRLKLSVNAA